MADDVSGVQLAREIRHRHPAVRILLTTSSVDRPADVKNGEFPVLLKPYSVESLAGALTMLLDGELVPT
jgi:DNA-binding response OmpR family regulator